jgi:tetratricopeptide (TPR) repeat protein
MTYHRVTESHRRHDYDTAARRACLRRGARLAICMYLVVATAVAHAQSADPGASHDQLAAGADADAGTPSRPWAEGLPLEVRLDANRIFLEGNALMREGLFLQATEKYQAALALWDHPGFHYNLAIAQINLDQPIAAYESLQRAVRHGAAPFGADKLEQAESFLTLLRNQLAHVEVACDEPGAVVTMDGKPLFTAPGRMQIVALPGGHQLMADKDGRLPDTERIVLAPGQRARFDLAPQVPTYLATEHRWPVWKPWAVIGAGAIIATAGGYFDWRSSSSFARYDRSVGDLCPGNAGCDPGPIPDALSERQERAETEQWIARGIYLASGTAMAAGAVLVYLNRERAVRRRDVVEITLRPVFEPRAIGVSAGLEF